MTIASPEDFTAQLGQPPRAKQLKKFNEAIFLKRSRLLVDSDLARFFDLQVRVTRPHTALKGRQLSNNESETTMFGRPGSVEHAETLQKAVDLGQIAGKIQAQWNYEEGELHTNGSSNIFPVCDKNDALCVAYVYRYVDWWRFHCAPFRADKVWFAGERMFSN